MQNETTVFDWSFANDILPESSPYGSSRIILDFFAVYKTLSDAKLVEHCKSLKDDMGLFSYFVFEHFSRCDNHEHRVERPEMFVRDSDVQKNNIDDVVLKVYEEIEYVCKTHIPGFNNLVEPHCNCILNISTMSVVRTSIALDIDNRAFEAFVNPKRRQSK